MTLEFPDDLKYSETHEYVRMDGDIATIGISAYAIDQLGDVVFMELPEVGDLIEKGESFGSVESVKAVEDLKAPITGTVIECNKEILEETEKLSEDPYIEGWLLKVRVKDPDELNGDDIYSADDYRKLVEGE
ncbi:MAG: glycine cleavage system protein GcvH [Trichodesmium sp. ALOHA_ZT_67]|nr:glycine cleavage system protein GcvH [Trichodesmium sp. ALOHA_ZT_67]